jgi:hypothetical protein
MCRSDVPIVSLDHLLRLRIKSWQRARVAPAEVQAWVHAQGDAPSPLSRREALKHIGAGDGASAKTPPAAPRRKRRRSASDLKASESSSDASF